jgi:hypothetical protein
MLPSTLDRLVAALLLDPRERCRQGANLALLSFTLPTATIEGWNAFRGMMIRALAHIEQHLYGLKEPVTMSPEFAWGRCVALLAEVYGTESGAKAAFELARTGQEGGAREVVRRLAYHMADRMAQTHIHVGVRTMWNSLTAQEKHAATEEFLTKYGHLLPSELTEGGGWRVRADLPGFLEQFAASVRSMNQIRGG